MISRRLTALSDRMVCLLLSLADCAARRSRVPNPMAGMQVLLWRLADQNLSGADFYDLLTSDLDRLGFTWPDGLCDECDAPLTLDEAEGAELCATCSPAARIAA
ncbi:hypothetical protein [Streptomyces nigrescens]|uniref:hypothetical protein n=1 Tax=Streptomyces nigrescens TaxID=1920 RepID=UPI0036F5822F